MSAVYDNQALLINGFEIEGSRVIMNFILDGVFVAGFGAELDEELDTQEKANIEQNNIHIKPSLIFIFSSVLISSIPNRE